MRIRSAIALLCLVSPLLAGGEYDSLHFGFRLGAAWAPDKSFGSLGSQAPGTVATDTLPMQFAGVLGLEARYTVIPGKLSISLIADGLDTISKETGDPTGTGGDVKQTNVRGEFRVGINAHGNQNEGLTFWLAPTYNLVATSNDLYSLHEHKMGAALGLSGFSHKETYSNYWDIGVYTLPKFQSGTTAGKVTIEIKYGWLW